MTAAEREAVTRTKDLIEATRREIIQLRTEIKNARASIEHSLELLAHWQPD